METLWEIVLVGKLKIVFFRFGFSHLVFLYFNFRSTLVISLLFFFLPNDRQRRTFLLKLSLLQLLVTLFLHVLMLMSSLVCFLTWGLLSKWCDSYHHMPFKFCIFAYWNHSPKGKENNCLSVFLDVVKWLDFCIWTPPRM